MSTSDPYLNITLGPEQGTSVRLVGLEKRVATLEATSGRVGDVNGAVITPGTITSAQIYAGTIQANLIQTSNLSAGSVTTSILHAQAVTADKLAAILTVSSTIQTDVSPNARVTLNTSGIYAYGPGNVEKLGFDIATGSMRISGVLTAGAGSALPITYLTSGSLVTGTIFRLDSGGYLETSATNPRVVIDSAGWRSYNSSGVLTTQIDNTGSTINAGTIQGPVIRTATPPADRLEISSGSFKSIVSSTNVVTLDTTVGLDMLVGSNTLGGGPSGYLASTIPTVRVVSWRNASGVESGRVFSNIDSTNSLALTGVYAPVVSGITTNGVMLTSSGSSFMLLTQNASTGVGKATIGAVDNAGTHGSSITMTAGSGDGIAMSSTLGGVSITIPSGQNLVLGNSGTGIQSAGYVYGSTNARLGELWGQYGVYNGLGTGPLQLGSAYGETQFENGNLRITSGRIRHYGTGAADHAYITENWGISISNDNNQWNTGLRGLIVGTASGGIAANSGFAYLVSGGGGWLTWSDPLVKHGARDVDPVLDRLRLLRPKAYYKRLKPTLSDPVDGEHPADTLHEYGLMADEVQGVLPDLVESWDPTALHPEGMKWVQTGGPMNVFLVKAVQEMADKIDVLETRLRIAEA